ncbi:MAG TPA: DUF4403 family protein [Thermoanaerobaculia bacterium]
MTRKLPLLLAVTLLAGCSGARVQAPPPAPVAPASVLGPAEGGRASFFFPVAIPLAEVRRIVEASLPPRVSDERRQEISAALQDDFYRYTLERGPVEVGFGGKSGERLTFSFPVKGSLTIGGRLAGVPVQETVEISGRVLGTASLSITPDWRPDPRPTARVELDRADLNVLNVFSVSVRSFLEGQLNPILDRELQQAARRLLADLALRRQAEEAWRSLHVARRAAAGENLWVRFQPLEISLARVTGKDGALHTGIGIAGQISLVLGAAVASPAVALLPPLRIDAERAGGFAVEVPVAASPGELSRWVDRELRGKRFRIGRGRELEITGAGLGVDGDKLVLAVDFQTGGRDGRLVLRGHPAVDPGTRVLRLADLEYDLASGGLFLRMADRLHRAELLAKLQKSAHLDLAPLLAQAERQTARAVRDLFPPGVKGDVRVEPIRVLGIGVAGGQVWARCRVAGAIPALGPALSASPSSGKAQ